MQHNCEHKWTTLEAILKFKGNFKGPVLTDHASMESLFIQLSGNV